MRLRGEELKLKVKGWVLVMGGMVELCHTAMTQLTCTVLCFVLFFGTFIIASIADRDFTVLPPPPPAHTHTQCQAQHTLALSGAELRMEHS